VSRAKSVDTTSLASALARLARTDGRRIARRNARWLAFGALRSIRLAIDRVFPVIPKPARAAAPDAKVAGKSWREVEYMMLKPGKRVWDRADAEAFNVYLGELDGHPAKPIRFDINPGNRLWGQHTKDAIRLKPLPAGASWRDAQLWRTFLHELAHYRVHGHGRAFRVELLRVYKLWRAFNAAEPQRRVEAELEHWKRTDPTSYAATVKEQQ